MTNEHADTIILCLIAGTVMALFASLAIWAMVSQRPRWFIRFAILLGPIALLLPITAYEAALYFLYQSVLIIGAILVLRGGLALLRWARSRWRAELSASQQRTRPQITLKELFFVTTLVSIAFAIATAAATHFPADDWHQLHPPAVMTTLMALTAALAASSRGRWWWRVLSVAIFAVTTVAASGDASSSGLNRLVFGKVYLDYIALFSPMEFEGLIVAVHAALTITILALWCVSFPISARGPSDRADGFEHGKPLPTVSRFTRVALALIGILIACPLGYLYWRMATPPAIPPARTGEPNNIDELLAIAKRFEDVTIPDEDNNYKGLKAFAAKHAVIVGEVRGALARPSFIPVSYTNYTGAVESLELFSLARALELIGRDAENLGQNQQAINVYSDVMRLGHVATADGLLIDCLVGKTFERLGRDSLRMMRHKLSNQQRRELIRKIDGSEDAIGPLDDFIGREKIWAMHAYGWQGRLQAIVNDLTGSESEFFNEENVRDMLDRDLANHRMLVIAMAISIYRDEHGTLPKSLDRLVPKISPRVIRDPFGPGSFVYRRQDDRRYMLYSLGQNQRDDGGVIVTESDKSFSIQGDGKKLLPIDDAVDFEQGDLFLDQSDWEVEGK